MKLNCREIWWDIIEWKILIVNGDENSKEWKIIVMSVDEKI